MWGKWDGGQLRKAGASTECGAGEGKLIDLLWRVSGWGPHSGSAVGTDKHAPCMLGLCNLIQCCDYVILLTVWWCVCYGLNHLSPFLCHCAIDVR